MTECCVATIPACFENFAEEPIEDVSMHGWAMRAFAAERAPRRVAIVAGAGRAGDAGRAVSVGRVAVGRVAVGRVAVGRVAVGRAAGAGHASAASCSRRGSAAVRSTARAGSVRAAYWWVLALALAAWVLR